MFRATMCPSSGETTVYLRHLVLVILCGWLSGMQGGIPDSHPHRITSTKCHINTVVSPDDGPVAAPKHVETDKYINILRSKNCAPSWFYLQKKKKSQYLVTLSVVSIACQIPFISSAFPSIHLWHYSPFRVVASLIRRLHSSLFAPLLRHPLIPSTCSSSLWTTSAHLVLGLPTGLVVWKFPFRTFFGILSSSILIIWPAHSSLLILMSSTMFGTLYKLYSSLFHLGRQHPLSCVGPYILRNIFLSNVLSICSDVCVRVQVTFPSSAIPEDNFLPSLMLYTWFSRPSVSWQS